MNHQRNHKKLKDYFSTILLYKNTLLPIVITFLFFGIFIVLGYISNALEKNPDYIFYILVFTLATTYFSLKQYFDYSSALDLKHCVSEIYHGDASTFFQYLMDINNSPFPMFVSDLELLKEIFPEYKRDVLRTFMCGDCKKIYHKKVREYCYETKRFFFVTFYDYLYSTYYKSSSDLYKNGQLTDFGKFCFKCLYISSKYGEKYGLVQSYFRENLFDILSKEYTK